MDLPKIHKYEWTHPHSAVTRTEAVITRLQDKLLVLKRLMDLDAKSRRLAWKAYRKRYQDQSHFTYSDLMGMSEYTKNSSRGEPSV